MYLMSSVKFDTDPLPSLCPGSQLQLTCIAINFASIDWELNGDQLDQYTATSPVHLEQNPREHLSLILNERNFTDPLAVDFNTTLTATVGDGVTSGDVVSCGNRFFNMTDLLINYTNVCKSIKYESRSIYSIHESKLNEH